MPDLLDPYGFWEGMFPGIDANAAKMSASKAQQQNALAQLEDLSIADINQITLLSNPHASITDSMGRQVKLDGSWRMKIVNGRATFFPCS